MIIAQLIATVFGKITASTGATGPTKTITEIFDVYRNKYTVLLLSAENAGSATFADSSGNFGITVGGTPAQGSISPLYATGYYSIYFDGSSSYITTPNTSNFDLSSSTTAFTIEAWIYPTDLSTYRGIMGARQSAVAHGWCLFVSSNKTLYTGSVIVGNAYDNRQLNPTNISTNVWTHIAVVKDATGYTAFVNGVAGTKIALTGGFDYQSGQPFAVGALSSGGEYPFLGYISNVRIVKGTAVYTDSFTPSFTPLTAITNTVSLTCQSNRFVDNFSPLSTISVFGTPRISPLRPFLIDPLNLGSSAYSGSIYFNGTTDYLTASSSGYWSLNSINFTVELWFYATGNAGSNRQLVGLRSSATATSWQLTIGSNNVLGFNNGLNGGYTGKTIDLFTWYHVACVRNGTTLNVYLNGSLVVSNIANTSTAGDAAVLGIGANGFTGFTEKFAGYITNLRIVRDTAVYTTDFALSTTPLTVISGTVLLLNANNTELIDSTGFNSIIPSSSTSMIGAGSGKYGNASMYFNASTYFTVLTNQLLAFGTNNFTVELWVYPTLLNTATRMLVDFRPSAVNGAYFTLYIEPATNKVVYYSNTAAKISSTATLAINNWYHIAVSRSGSNTRLYINGVQSGSTFVDSNTYLVGANSGRPIVGAAGTDLSSKFQGYMDNLRITNGISLYNGNFTPVDVTQTITGDIYQPTQQQLYLKGNVGVLTNTVTDSSTNNFAITKFGNPGQGTFSPSSIGYYSTYFSGSDYLISTAGTEMSFGTGAFTVELWIYLDSFSPTPMMLIDCRLTNTNTTCLGGWSVPSTGLCSWTQNNVTRFTSTKAITLKTWTHLAVCKSGTTITFYQNGIQAAQVGDNLTYTCPRFVLGTNGFNNTLNRFTGYMSNLRILKGTALYNGEFTPSTTPVTATGTTFVTCYDGTLKANQIRGVTPPSTAMMTVTGTPKIYYRYPDPFPLVNPTFGSTTPGSYYFNGSTDYLTVQSSSDLAFGTGDFTIEFWHYRFADQNQYIFVSGTTPNWGETTGVQLINYQGNFALSVGAAGNSALSPNPSINAWHHIAIVRNGSSVKLYLNGASVGTLTDSTNLTGTALRIGHGVAGSWATFAGYISNLRIVKGTAIYTANFATSTQILTAGEYNNTSLLLLAQNSNLIDSSYINNSLTIVGDVKSVAIGSGNTMYFNGSSYAFVSGQVSDQIVNFAAGDFTVEMWLYFTTVPANCIIIDYRPLNTGGAYFTFYMNASSQFIYHANNANQITGPVPVANTWYHIAVVRGGQNINMYVNGDQVNGTYADTSIYLTPPNRPIIGGDGTVLGTSMFTGYMDNFRVSTVARYTGNFVLDFGKISGWNPTSTASITANSSSILSGNTVSFSITTTNVDNGTTLIWDVSDSFPSIRLSDRISSGSVVVNNNAATIVLTTANVEGFYGTSRLGLTLSTTSGINITSSTVTVTGPTAPASVAINYLVVAGGGGGGAAGGGGAGGVLQTITNLAFNTNYTITVGAGGTGALGSTNGQNSSIVGSDQNLIAVGGGAGATQDLAQPGAGVVSSGYRGANGGSGGGGGGNSQGNGATIPGGTGLLGQGFSGGSCPSAAGSRSGGGGGAGGVGADSPSVAGAGGIGLSDAQVGGLLTRATAGAVVSTTRYIAGGGGGGAYNAGGAGLGGSGGGGTGSQGGVPTAGTAYTGGGGGGSNRAAGGLNGGSGVVIISYSDTLPAATATGAETPIVSGGFRTYKWNSSGSIRFNS